MRTAIFAALVLVLPAISFARSPDLCALDQRKPPFAKVENEKKDTVAGILKIDTDKINARAWTPGKVATAEALKLIHTSLSLRPRMLSNTRLWSEKVMLTKQGVVASLIQTNGKPLRMEVQGIYGCVQDQSGRYWYFRAGVNDLWTEADLSPNHSVERPAAQ